MNTYRNSFKITRILYSYYTYRTARFINCTLFLSKMLPSPFSSQLACLKTSILGFSSSGSAYSTCAAGTCLCENLPGRLKPAICWETSQIRPDARKTRKYGLSRHRKNSGEFSPERLKQGYKDSNLEMTESESVIQSSICPDSTVLFHI